MLQKEEDELQKKTRWLWYEFTPYEVGCDELGVSAPRHLAGQVRRWETHLIDRHGSPAGALDGGLKTVIILTAG
jgi:hypothetical protein